MNRLLLNLAALASLLLLIFALLCWPLSYLPDHLAIDACRGKLVLIFWGRPMPVTYSHIDPGSKEFVDADLLWEELDYRGNPTGPKFNILGFGTIGSYVYDCRLFAVPFWFIILVSAIPPAYWLRLRLGQSRCQRQGLCPSCSYDLRYSKDKCPECGSPIPVITKENQPKTINHLQQTTDDPPPAALH